jgi:hypothetical protein
VRATHLTFVALALLSAGTQAAATTLAFCEKSIRPRTVVAPVLPAKLHNEFRGTVEVGFLVDTDGKVLEPWIHTRDLHPVGHGGSRPEGYDDAVLSLSHVGGIPSGRSPAIRTPRLLSPSNEAIRARRPNSSLERPPTAKARAWPAFDMIPTRHGIHGRFAAAQFNR